MFLKPSVLSNACRDVYLTLQQETEATKLKFSLGQLAHVVAYPQYRFLQLHNSHQFQCCEMYPSYHLYIFYILSELFVHIFHSFSKFAVRSSRIGFNFYYKLCLEPYLSVYN